MVPGECLIWKRRRQHSRAEPFSPKHTYAQTHQRRGRSEALGSLTPTNLQTLYLSKTPLQIKCAYNQATLIHSEFEEMWFLWATTTCESHLTVLICICVSASTASAVTDGENMSVKQCTRMHDILCVCVFAWHDSASDAAHGLDLDFCLCVTPAAPSSLINRTDEDRLLLLCEEKQ